MSTDTPDVRELVRTLNASLGPTLVAALAGDRDQRISIAWSGQDGPLPSPEAMERLQCAWEQFQLIARAEGSDVARLWFIGTNPRLDDDAPAEAIMEGRFGEVAAAARVMTNGDGFA